MSSHQNIFATLFPHRKTLVDSAPESDDIMTDPPQGAAMPQPPAPQIAAPSPAPSPVSEMAMKSGVVNNWTPPNFDGLFESSTAQNDTQAAADAVAAIGGGGQSGGAANGAAGNANASMTPLELKAKEYADLLASKAQKQPAWKQALFLGLQTANKFFNPQDQSEIRFLGDVKRENAIRQTGQQLGALQVQEQQKQAAAAARQKVLKDDVDYRYRQAQLTALQNKPAEDIAADRRRLDAQIKMKELEERAKGREFEKITDKNGLVSLLYKDGHVEPLNDPRTNDQWIDEGARYYTATDPQTGEPIQVKGSDKLANSTTLTVGDAQRQQQADQFNSSQEFEAQKTNATNIAKYYSDSLALAQQLAAQQGKNIENLAELQGYEKQMSQLKDQLNTNKLNPGERDFSGKKLEQYNKTLTDIAELDAKYQKALGATEAGKLMLGELQKRGIQRPPTVHAVRVEARQVGGAKSTISESEARAKMVKAFPNETPAQINARLAQARSDGWIK